MTEPRTGHIRVPRTARFHLLGPEDGRAVREVWVVLHGYRQLAGRFLRRFRPLDDGTRLVVAPEGLSRFYVETVVRRHGPESVTGASWMTRDDREREIDDYVAYLDRLAAALFGEGAGASPAARSGRAMGAGSGPEPAVRVEPGGLTRVDRESVRLTVLGFSQGVATAARWAVLGSWPPDRLVLWGDTLPPDLPPERAAERLRAVEVVSVRGDEDPAVRAQAASDEAERLAAWGVAREVRTYPGGHRVEEEPLSALARAGRPPQNSPTKPISGTSS